MKCVTHHLVSVTSVMILCVFVCCWCMPPGRPGKPDRPGEPDRPGVSDRPDRPGEPDRSGEPDRPGRPDRPGGPMPPHGMAKGHDNEHTNGQGPKKKMGTRYGLMKKAKGHHYIKKFKWGRHRGHHHERPGSEESVMELQRMVGLEVTGEIDEPTARLMSWPRCGWGMLQDDNITGEGERNITGEGERNITEEGERNITEEGERKKRYIAAGSTLKWDKVNLTYKIKNYPNTTISVITKNEVHEAVNTALKLWTDATLLTFTRLEADIPADIVLRFGKGTHTKVSGDPAFDGPGGTLAHAFTPNSGWGNLNGDVHYDDDESFTHKKYFGRNLQYVTAHEVGHALGLDHSDVFGSLMWPWIIGYVPDYKLPEDDRLGIQSIYGENPNLPVEDLMTTELPVITTLQPVPAPYCNITFDDVAIIRSEIYAFKDKIFWKFSSDGYLANGLEGSPTRGYFKRVPSSVSGIFERWHDEKVILVKGKYIWQLDGVIREEGFPKLLSEMEVPRAVACVMHRASTGITYYFKSRLAYEYDEFEETLLPDTPRKIHQIFPGIPIGTILTGSFTGMDGYGYLLSGENYYTVNPNMESDGELGNFAQDFLRCPPR